MLHHVQVEEEVSETENHLYQQLHNRAKQKHRLFYPLDQLTTWVLLK